VGEPYFVPGTPITIDRRGLGDARPGDLVEVTEGRGRARVRRVIGSAKRIENVLEALLVDEGLREGFEPHDVPAPSLDGRTDFRDLTTFTIDPDTAKDFDDAISVRREGDGVRVWVHIADVSYFVPAGSPLDRGAERRGNSVYVPGLVAPMLPHELADDVCSLRPHQDRLCLTVEIAPGGEPSQGGESVAPRCTRRWTTPRSYSMRRDRVLAGELLHAHRRRVPVGLLAAARVVPVCGVMVRRGT